MGNSPDDFFIGPEVPGRPANEGGRFKDREGRMKRQAARFRVYAFDANDKVVKELTAAEADITWTVHLVNAKGAWHVFRNFELEEAAAGPGGTPLPLRNPSVTDRESLKIDPGPRSIGGTDQTRVRFDTGTFLGEQVKLGELRTDGAGRLLVLGGFGRAESVPMPPLNKPIPIKSFANNDTWFDDISDGPVTASVVLKNGQPIPMKAGSWVVVGPPDYAPAVENIVTLYDVQVRVARDAGWQTAPDPVSFTRDVFPILSRSVGYRWVNSRARRGHGQGAAGDLLDPLTLCHLARNAAEVKHLRMRVFERLRNPNLTGEEAVAQANYHFMPQLSGDIKRAEPGDAKGWLSLLPHQYEVMRRWAEGEFDEDWPGKPPIAVTSVGHLPVAEQPHALDRAANEACAGGGFHPGIEVTYNIRDPRIYLEPHRLRPELQPGDLTKRMAVPWHGDFYECDTIWWPAQRPDEVITEAEFEAVLKAYGFDGDAEKKPEAYEDLHFTAVPWARGIAPNIETEPDPVPPDDGDPCTPPVVLEEDPTAIPSEKAGDNDLVKAWSELGVVRPRRIPGGGRVLVEGERRPYYRMSDREAFHIMLNIESYPDFLPTARQIAERFLDDARALQRSTGCPDELRHFEYSAPVFRSRLDQIYTTEAQIADAFVPREDIFTREYRIEVLTQFAPFNQIDGAWLRNIGRLGPIDEVHAMLFHVFIDELGNGDPKLNHANLYTDLLHSVGVYLPPVSSRAYIDDERLADEAFPGALIQLVIGQFPEDYLPEALGMTLWIEWGSIGLKSSVKVLNALGINPTYYSLHVGIDNATTGHGAMAKRAVEIYLDEVRASSGDQAMKDAWSRIWNGYVAFAIAGKVGAAVRKFRARRDPAVAVKNMIERKAHFGSQNHGKKQVGAKPINEWFADPEGFMSALVDSGYIIPGDVDNSPFFKLLKPSGPMFRVFTDDEIQIWESWTRTHLGKIPSIPENRKDLWMEQMVKTLRHRQQGTAGHRVLLTGKTPEGTVAKPVSWWFERPAAELLQALADPINGWVVPRDPAASLFISDRASGDHPMARVLLEVAPGTKNKTWRKIAVEWIEAGCPIPPVTPAPQASLVAAEASVVDRARVLVAAGGVVAPATEGAEALAASGKIIAPGYDGGVPVTAVTPALSEDGRSQPRVPLLRLYQNETWQPEYAHIPIYGNGSVH